MKSFAFLGILLLLASCQDNKDLVIEVKDVAFTAVKLQSIDGSPFSIEDSISGNHFGFKVDWNIESNIYDAGYDPVETSVVNSNPIIEFKISSNKTINGISPGNSLNNLFVEYYSPEGIEEPLAIDAGLQYFKNFNTFDEPLRKYSFLKATSVIPPNSYHFYFRSELKDGTILLDTNLNVKIK